jgi:hypothetical protein
MPGTAPGYLQPGGARGAGGQHPYLQPARSLVETAIYPIMVGFGQPRIGKQFGEDRGCLALRGLADHQRVTATLEELAGQRALLPVAHSR